MISAVYWVIKNTKSTLNLICSFSPSHPSSAELVVWKPDRSKDDGSVLTGLQGVLKRTYVRELCLSMRPLAGCVRGRVGVQRQPRGISMKSSRTVKTELQFKRNNRSNAEAKELDRYGLLHLLHTVCSDDLISSGASRWTYPLGRWSTAPGLNDRVWSEWAEPWMLYTSLSSRHVTCTFFSNSPVQAKTWPHWTRLSILSSGVRDLFWARWFGERSREVFIFAPRFLDCVCVCADSWRFSSFLKLKVHSC